MSDTLYWVGKNRKHNLGESLICKVVSYHSYGRTFISCQRRLKILFFLRGHGIWDRKRENVGSHPPMVYTVRKVVVEEKLETI